MFVNDERVSLSRFIHVSKPDNLNLFLFLKKRKKQIDRYRSYQGWLRDQISLPSETEWTIAFHQNHGISSCNEREVKCVMTMIQSLILVNFVKRNSMVKHWLLGKYIQIILVKISKHLSSSLC